MQASSRHHYLPQFYIKNFVDFDGALWRYDKFLGKIEDRKFYPKQLFYENNINNIILESHEIEFESHYSKIDSKISTYISRVDDPKFSNKLEDFEYIVNFNLFIIFLYWRLPATRVMANKLVDLFKVFKPFWHTINFLNSHITPLDDEVMKIYRAVVPLELMAEPQKISENNSQIRFKIIDHKSDCLLLGDNPILFEEQPYSLESFTSSLVFPLSKSKMYGILRSDEYKSDFRLVNCFNILTISQAKRYICHSDKEVLMKYIDAYQKTNHPSQINLYKRYLFEAFNGKPPINPYQTN